MFGDTGNFATDTQETGPPRFPSYKRRVAPFPPGREAFPRALSSLRLKGCGNKWPLHEPDSEIWAQAEAISPRWTEHAMRLIGKAGSRL